ncbi:MAG: HAD-IG family 5'-nucleotidase [Bdellovibrionales bacterium]|nr:HAD-IG family 5'-nucleotidase [Bdellovibrionales bacterium]
MHNQVYVNRTLNMRKIKFIGLDMDHTLVRYNTKAFEELAYQGMLQKLVADKNYPEDVLKLKFDFDFVIRGLVIDHARGNLLKVSRHGAIRGSRHGTETISFQQQQKDYKGKYVDLGGADFSSIDTAFSISVAILFSQLVELKDETSHKYPDYGKLLEDIVEVMDMAHRDDSLKSVVRDNMEKYIIQEPSVAEGLERYKKHGKSIFILTNSDFHYTKALLDYAINPFLKNHKNWMELFDYTITSARKPRFFYDNINFLKVNPSDGTMTNYDADLIKGIYQGGCADLFEKSLQVSGDDILYIGDHIYGDIVRLKKDCNWRTALVVDELNEEIAKMKKAKPARTQIQDLMDKKLPLEKQLVDLVSDEIEQGVKHDEEIAKLQTAITQLDNQISPLIKQSQSLFNAHWGEVMRAGNEESYFANQVERFADIYMPTLADLLAQSPRTYFRSHRRPMPHEIGLDMTAEEI